MKAVVFAYHNVGVRCLKALLSAGVDVAFVVTHEDDPAETIWFESVDAVCQEHGITSVKPANATSTELLERVRAAAPDFLFSFYYRHMLPVDLLALARRGAYNMHGSLLPKYRGRAPVNWAVLNGEKETGATLHEMTGKPDAGPIVAQTAVPILPDDTAHEVFGKLTVAAEMTLWKVLPAILAGVPPCKPNHLEQGSYFAGRRPEDGRIDWSQPAHAVYNLYRAVAPPYPGAFTELSGKRYVIGKARLASGTYRHLGPGLTVIDGKMLGVCGDGRALRILELLREGASVSSYELQTELLSS